LICNSSLKNKFKIISTPNNNQTKNKNNENLHRVNNNNNIISSYILIMLIHLIYKVIQKLKLNHKKKNKL